MHAFLLPQTYVSPISKAERINVSLHVFVYSNRTDIGPSLETKQKRLVLVAALACVCSYIAIMGVVLLRCLPFHRNWQVYPYPGGKRVLHEQSSATSC